MVALLITNVGLTVVGGLLGGFDSLLPKVPVSLAVLATLVPSLAVQVRRLHDTGRTGRWWSIALVPVVGAVVLLVLLCLPSQGDNAYGAGPTPGEYDEAHPPGLPPHFTGPYHQPPWWGGSESSY